MNEKLEMIRTGIRLRRDVWERFGEGCDALNLVKTRVFSELMEEWIEQHKAEINHKLKIQKDRE